MQTLQGTVEEVETILRTMTPDETHQLGRLLRRLNLEQFTFVRETLDYARIKGGSPVGHLRILEHCFEEWQTHDLATKLAQVGQLRGETDAFDSARADFGWKLLTTFGFLIVPCWLSQAVSACRTIAVESAVAA